LQLAPQPFVDAGAKSLSPKSELVPAVTRIGVFGAGRFALSATEGVESTAAVELGGAKAGSFISAGFALGTVAFPVTCWISSSSLE
jgi:hypothetical protein